MEINQLQRHLSHCGDLVRVGGPHERGHLIPARAISKTKTLLSLGANGNWRFDRAFQELNPECQVVAVDHNLSLSSVLSDALSSGIKLLRSAFLGKVKQSKCHAQTLLNQVLLYMFYNNSNRLLRRRVSNQTNEVDIRLETLIAVYGTIDDNATMLNINMSCQQCHLLEDIIALESMLSVVTIELSPLPTNVTEIEGLIDQMSACFDIVNVSSNGVDVDQAPSIDCLAAPLELTFMNKRLSR
ncbi:hypothetical protein [Pseudoalteromonas luteoviolacea]|uniref:Uncharacterized protein n=1 Tax=Pseudoalteromonas luteoviolacea S4054 TaxID=1129367 RepID=A0A0F6AFD9_9GAMM|nr:hypothetical protein [Pseudoalteromonas luteoviolacea]AOT09995.1 hypothetical protein S4054249_20205 [Pseudoalteromonas luteoviolacea]AOT14906.1 hypothetical protein S40542_20175 [Pseudoalteromonas luteoviolacea]AOT19822.1 hypothetical protein S4054_20180 [Pseudoalteromonas luteoviolacea]KKE84927.1 hypothetical protein N479_07470 [Pseudoalteromonas luteoviolacea S4054]KZN72544.1 hypothetical protein N481_15060 [Pseudoalteromonas luteoviolacea S4047-1]